MKIIAYYLPQFHEIPENNDWWGEGFTEWTNVKSAKPIYNGHSQPRKPFNLNYYDLLNDDVKIWQANLAKQYGIYGFCYYHYWFNGKLLLHKPMEQMIKNHKINLPFCICWANEPWTKQWVGKERTVLYPQKYGGKPEWEDHFYYLLPFFRDKRYICIDNKPLFIVYRPEEIPCISQMMELWKDLSVENGLDGMIVAGVARNISIKGLIDMNDFDYIIEWQPSIAKDIEKNKRFSNFEKAKILRRKLYTKFEQSTGIDLFNYSLITKYNRTKYKLLNYDLVWENIINQNPLTEKSIPGAFVNWDNTPRFQSKGTIIEGSSPSKFRKYLSDQIVHARESYESEYMFLFAWNEWAEGSYLEPDEEYKYEYLKAVKYALKENNEFPSFGNSDGFCFDD